MAQKADLSSWPGPVLKFYMGRMTEDALMAAAADPDPQTHVGEACEANFYAGENALEHQRQAAALGRFRSVHDNCIKDYVEYGAALAELKHMTGAPAKTDAVPAKTSTAPGLAEKGGIQTEERVKAKASATPSQQTRAKTTNTPSRTTAGPSMPEMGGTQLEDRAEAASAQ